MCLNYEPLERPSFRTVLRELTEIMIKSAFLLAHLIIFYQPALLPFNNVFVFFCPQILIYPQVKLSLSQTLACSINAT